MIIDFRSDTVTQPSPGMLEAMSKAEVGDDVFGEDKTVIALQERLACMFGMQDGLFFPSGTMANQTAVKAHTEALDEIICDKLCHIYNYETGAWSMISGVSVRLTEGIHGKMTTNDIEKLILPNHDWYPNTKLVCIENTVNKGGGSVYSLDEMKAISAFCKSKNLLLHCDGARIFNALTSLEMDSSALDGLFDSISVCLSKGLGAPVGSVLLGSKTFIKKARKIRKALGGGMRQVGYLAAAGLYALEHNINRLAIDHAHTKMLASALQASKQVNQVLPVESNIVIAEIEDSSAFAAKLALHGIKAQPFSPTQIRFVTHLDITEEMTHKTCEVISRMN